jgi:hypothetical protein
MVELEDLLDAKLAIPDMEDADALAKEFPRCAFLQLICLQHLKDSQMARNHNG